MSLRFVLALLYVVGGDDSNFITTSLLLYHL